MSISDMKGKVQTVLGPIDGQEMGITLPHEHVFIDMSVWFIEPEGAAGKYLAEQPISRDHPDIGRFRIYPYSNRDNLRLLEEQEAVNELLAFKHAGGRTIVDNTNVNLARDPDALCRVSRATGLNIIMGSGYYVGEAQDRDFDSKSEERIADEIISDITIGVGLSKVRVGLIGELGCSWPLHDRERKVLRAAARAQKQTGIPINIHPGRHEDSPMQIIRILGDAGADLHRVIMSHMDRTPFPLQKRLEMAKAGCVLEYDVFGWEGYYPTELAVAHMPNDVQRIKEIIELAEQGFLNQVLISHDICYKTRRYTYGGHGYSHILRNVVPVMRCWSMSEEDINTIIIENPRRLFSMA
ncbi:MAG: TatD family hydrolase [Deltaproteobacteria bacterium]|nr:TatD family hydrolase [Deltaproteobacteria bacterium]